MTRHETQLTTAGVDWSGRAGAHGLNQDLIDRLVAASAVAEEAERRPIVAPFTGAVIGELRVGTPADVERAVARAREAQTGWAARSIAERCAVLERVHDLVLQRREQALDLIQLESGKARRHALDEVLDVALVSRHYAFHAADYLKPRKHRSAFPLLTSVVELHHPIGVVGCIAPWNFPLVLNLTDMLPALAAGNAAVLRPDEQSSLTALWAAELLYEAGLPRDCFQVVTGDGAALGPTLIDTVDFVMFTGSTKTGRIVARQAGERLKGISLELGGKNPMVVLPDADVAKAADGLVRGAFIGAGQVCLSIERTYVHESMFERFAAEVVRRTKAMKLSAELEYGIDMGSLTVPRQLVNVSAHVEDAIAKGATVLTGGRARPDIGPLFYEPTVLTGVTPDMRLFAEETFGPVVSLYPYSDVDDAIARANDTPYGLNASVWTKNEGQGFAVASRIRSGAVNINEALASTWAATAAPVGGQKQSGLGRRHGEEGILKYTAAQTIATQRFMPMAPPPFMSDAQYADRLTRMLALVKRLPGLR